MPLAKDTQLQRVLDLNIEFRSNIGVTLTRDGKSIRGNLHTLAVLDTFSTPRTFEEGLDVLKSRIKGSQAWMEITYHIVHLYNTGILQSPEQRRRVLQSHHGRFESSPVHIRMLNDRSRTDSYQKAIRETVTAEDIVVDIGTGTGVLAATAAMAGAKHVYAVEAGSMGRLAQQIFDMNGLSDRITLIEGKSTLIELPEKADVMVSEIIGNDPLGENVIQTTEDAVKRLLNSGARLIPDKLNIYGLPVSIPLEILRKHIFTQETTEQWQRWYGIDFSPLVDATGEQNHFMRINTYETRDWLCLSDPVLLVEIDLKTHRYSDIKISRRPHTRNSGLLNAIIVYFEMDLGKTIHFSIHPDQVTPENSWASKVWIPGTPVPLESGEPFYLHYSYDNSGSIFDVQKNSSSFE